MVGSLRRDERRFAKAADHTLGVGQRKDGAHVSASADLLEADLQLPQTLCRKFKRSFGDVTLPIPRQNENFSR